MSATEETLKRLAVTFVVRDIMVSKNALTCAADEIDAVRVSKDNPDFSVIPIRRNGELDAYFERDSRTTKTITLDDLISDGTSLLDLFDIFVDSEFCFVLHDRRVAGYVHYSDLDHDLVKLTFYVILQALERQALSSLRVKDADQREYLNRWLDPCRFNQIEMSYKRNGDAARSRFNYLNISDILKLAVKVGTIHFDDDCVIKAIKDARDGAAHVSESLVTDYASVSSLRKVKYECLRILGGT